jgi:hypothetical protein
VILKVKISSMKPDIDRLRIALFYVLRESSQIPVKLLQIAEWIEKHPNVSKMLGILGILLVLRVLYPDLLPVVLTSILK